MEKKLILKSDILSALEKVGVRPGQVIMVHTSLGSIGYVCGGAQTMIEALIEAVGKDGTIMMPTQSWKNLDPETGVHWDVGKESWQAIRDNWPAYDRNITPTNTMGAVAEMFRQWKGAIRSDHPARSVAAYGKYAQYLTQEHDLSNIFGDGSPVGKLYELDILNRFLHLLSYRLNEPSRITVAVSSASSLLRPVKSTDSAVLGTSCPPGRYTVYRSSTSGCSRPQSRSSS